MNQTLEYLQTFARFPFALRSFLGHKLTLDEAKQIVRERMANREENFLRIVEKSVYQHPPSPYLKLLQWAQCEFGDLCARIKQKGLEGTLRELRAAGVYVTYEEFKGRVPIIRNGLEINVRARDFDNPFARRDFTLETGGSTGAALAVNQNLEHMADEAVFTFLFWDAHQLLETPILQWTGFLPGPSFRQVLLNARRGAMIDEWYSPNGWRDSKFWLKYDLATLYMFVCLRAYGVRVPFPRIVKMEQALVIAKRLSAMLKTRGRAILFAGPSRAIRVALAAEQVGIDLRGVVVRGGGEPFTPGKAAVLDRAGFRFIPGYSSTETGAMAHGCAKPTTHDDVHLMRDAFALITADYAIPKTNVTVPAFNLTSLFDSAPKLLLNMQIDDYGIVEERTCGCPLESYGYTTHLREIRSYTKLVAEGATLIGNDLVRIIEQILPARYGGTPLDYQWLEQEDETHLTRMYLVISPRIPIADDAEVITTVLDTLRETSPMADAARTVWQNAQTFRIKRQEPIWSARNKLSPLTIQRQQTNSNKG